MATKRRKITPGTAVVTTGGVDSLPVRAKFVNDLIDDIDAHIPTEGNSKFDTVSEFTSGSGVTVDGLLIKDGHAGSAVAITANATGVGAAIIPATADFVVVTSTNVNHIVSLPLLSTFPTGAQVRGTILNTGCELRVNPTDISASRYINGVTGGNELKMNNGTGCALFEAVKKTSTRWIVKTWSSVGGATAIVPDK